MSTKRPHQKVFIRNLLKNNVTRPTVEKLLQHSFFKNAKKNSYLVQNILANLPPITTRSHNRRPKQTKKEDEDNGESWDFSDTEGGKEGALSEQHTIPRGVQFDSLPRKSRFVVDEVLGGGETVHSLPSASSSDPPVIGGGGGGEVKKGRFTVNETSTAQNEEVKKVIDIPAAKPSRFTITSDTQGQRKSRFEEGGRL